LGFAVHDGVGVVVVVGIVMIGVVGWICVNVGVVGGMTVGGCFVGGAGDVVVCE